MADTEAPTPICGVDYSTRPLSDASNGDLGKILRDIPSHAVKDLLAHGVCAGCILRLFGTKRDVYPESMSWSSVLDSVYGDSAVLEKHSTDDGTEENRNCGNVSMAFCSLCRGILQFAYCDQKGAEVRKDGANEFAASIAELANQDGHQIDGFSLEVSIPQVILENELLLCSYMKRKYESEPWFQRSSLSECVSVKDALKTSISKPLEKIWDCKSNSSTFQIRVTYDFPKETSVGQSSVERNQGCKRRKTVICTSNGVETHGDCAKPSDFSTKEINEVVVSLESKHDSQLPDGFIFPLDKEIEPCQLVFQFNRTQIYFGGRYLKFSRNVSQTRWIIDDERMGDASVEELICGKINYVCLGDTYKFHAAGREDIDVRMLGSGRPFLVEIQNARRVPSEDDVKDIEKKINDLENKLVGVNNLKIVGSEGWTLMREGEVEKQKEYAALVWISRPLSDDDSQSICSYKELSVLQKTPIRVLHRRSPLEREKIIHWMRIEKIGGSSQYFLLHLCTQAGTYIKEFVHGDLGRTHPSVGSILDCRAEILQLDVTDVKMDCFL